jgi:hypothetical protein
MTEAEIEYYKVKAVMEEAGITEEDTAVYRSLADLSEEDSNALVANPEEYRRFELRERYGYRLQTYGTSPISARRRTKHDMEMIWAWLYCQLYDLNPMTVRQIFYRAVSAGVVAKTEQEYKGTICRLLTAMRKEEEIPYYWIADNTRWQRKPKTHNSMQDMLEETAKFYRRVCGRSKRLTLRSGWRRMRFLGFCMK